MISQVLPQSKLPSILDLGGAKPVDGGEGGGDAGGFSALLASLGDAIAAPEGEAEAGEGPAAAKAGDAATPEIGTALPGLAATGNILPPRIEVIAGATAEVAVAASNEAVAPVATTAPDTQIVEEDAAGEETQAADGEDTAPSDEASVEAIEVLLAPTLVAAPAATAPVAEGAKASLAAAATVVSAANRNSREPVPAQHAATDKPSAAPSVAIQVAPLAAGSGESGARSTGADAEANEDAEKFAAADRPTARERNAAERIAPEFATKVAARATAEAPLAQPAPVQAAAQPVAVAAQPTPAVAAEPAAAASIERPGIESQLTRELSRIVDSLSAAREAFTAKSATLALDHADFGELSLRFDQRRDGQLAVQLSAADPDTHRAVAAAVADRPAFGQADAGSSANQQQAGANASARGNATDRESGNSGNAPRSERGEQQRHGASTDDTDASGQRRSGIFA